MQYMLINFSFV